MFVGHYSAAFAAKAAAPRVPLWLLFVAAQAVDVAWAVLVLLGVERVRIVPGITAASPLDLTYMPYTHGLLATFLWAGAAYVAYRATSSTRGHATPRPVGQSPTGPHSPRSLRSAARYARGWRVSGLAPSREATPVRAALIVAAVVASHWLLDLLVHRPDLPLVGDALKVGLGLWNYPVVSLSLELGLLLGAMLLCTPALSRSVLLVFWSALAVVELALTFGPIPPSPQALVVSGLASYVLLAAAAGWVERRARRTA